MLTNQLFGELIALNRASVDRWGNAIWNCQCSCGNTTAVRAHRLTTGKTKSCGCLPTGKRTIDLIGQVFHRLTVVEYTGKDQYHGSMWKCMCICGNTTTVRRTALTTGKIKSCGCYKKEVDKSRVGEKNPNYDPTLTNIDRQQRRLDPRVKIWAFDVKKQYYFACDRCKANKQVKLVGHHLFNYKDFPELRFDTNNGVCLCSNCHIQFHKRYGYRHNTKQQYLDFKEQYNVNFSSSNFADLHQGSPEC